MSPIAMLQGLQTNSHTYQCIQKMEKSLSLPPVQLASYVGAGLCDRGLPWSTRKENQSEGLDWSVWKYCFNLLPFGEAENVDSSNNQYFIAAWLAVEEVLQFMGGQTMKLRVNSQLSQLTPAEDPTYHTGTFLKCTSAALHQLDEMKDAMELIVFTSLVLEMLVSEDFNLLHLIDC
ncbi:hypothetical protein DFJ73DRAFT_925642 [Zopfochytrium polystomum]|nr:hypothetical protein DFJ73DRAFT_925642 [Zopfochytrium polystomum]